MDSLSRTEKIRYSRHLLLPEIGIAGQEKLKQAKVLIIGAGGLGSPSSLYLAAAGIGTLGIVDFDLIDATNLQRQVLYDTDAVGKSKVQMAKERLSRLNPEITIRMHDQRFSASTAKELIAAYDIVIDGTDNFSTRYLVNDACVLMNKPNVYGSIFRFEGQSSVFSYAGGPCYRCLFPEPPEGDAIPNCAEGGVLGVIAGIIGCIQANECIKIICSIGKTLKGRLLLFDSLAMSFDELKIDRNPKCPVCGNLPTITELRDQDEICASQNQPEAQTATTSSNRVSTTKESTVMKEITAIELKKELSSGKELVVLDVRTPPEVALGHLESCVHIPLQELNQRLDELDKEKDIVVYCKSGGRSRRAIEVLQNHGFKHLRNLTGGITAWSFEVDPSIVVG